jgi:hypothetical protein
MQAAEVISVFVTASRPALGPTHPSIQRIQKFSYTRVQGGHSVKLTTRLYRLPNFKIYGASPQRYTGVLFRKSDTSSLLSSTY